MSAFSAYKWLIFFTAVWHIIVFSPIETPYVDLLLVPRLNTSFKIRSTNSSRRFSGNRESGMEKKTVRGLRKKIILNVLRKTP